MTLFLPIKSRLHSSLGSYWVVRKDGRLLRDILSGTGCVYARMAGLREKVEQAEKEPEVYSSANSCNALAEF